MALSGIRLNLLGREPAGLIRPGQEADAFVAELSEDLLAIQDDRTGQGLVRRVQRTRDICEGPQVEGLPDLLVEWADAVPTGSTAVAGGIGAEVSISSPKLGILTGRNHFGRTGEHRRHGLMIAAGPDIRMEQSSRRFSILDLAPTFCGVLGVDFPEAERTPIQEIVGAVHS